MKLGLRPIFLATAGTMVASLIGIAWAVGGPQSASPSSLDALTRSNGQTGLAVAVPLCGAEAYPGAAAQAGGQAGPAQGSQMSEDVFENIQVLRGIPVDEFMGTMGLYSAALTFCCSTCHIGAGFVNTDWAADSPRKQRARQMQLMVNTINSQNFGGRQVVTCWTCHRGGESPATTVAMSDIYTEPVLKDPDVLVQADFSPPADEVLDKYLEAVGGAERAAALTSIVATGTSVAFASHDETRQVEIFAQASGERTVLSHTIRGDFTTTYDGSAGWTATPFTPVPVMELTGGELDGARVDAGLAFPARIKGLFSDWRVGYADVIDDRLVQVVQGGSGTEGALVTLYFDDETGLLTRMVRQSPSAVGRNPSQYDYSDYREVAGVMMPFDWVFSWVSGRDVFEMSEIQPNVQIDPDRFAMPAPTTDSLIPEPQ